MRAILAALALINLVSAIGAVFRSNYWTAVACGCAFFGFAYLIRIVKPVINPMEEDR